MNCLLFEVLHCVSDEPYSVSVPGVREFIPPRSPGHGTALPPTPPCCGSVQVTGGCCAGGARRGGSGPGGVVNHISLAGCPVAAARGWEVVTGGGFPGSSPAAIIPNLSRSLIF